MAGKAGEPEVVEEAKKRFKLIVSGDNNAVHADLFGTVCAITVANGGQEEFDQLIELYKFFSFFFFSFFFSFDFYYLFLLFKIFFPSS